MKILYGFPEELPLPKARGLQTCATVSELARKAEVFFAAPFKADPFRFYDIGLPQGRIHLITLSRKIGPLKSVIFWALKLRLLSLRLKPDILFLRHPLAAYYLLRLKAPKVIFEVHEILKDKHPDQKTLHQKEAKIYLMASGLVFISQGLKKRAKSIYNLPPHTVIPSGTFLCHKCASKRFTKETEDIWYVGTVHYQWKGLETLLEVLNLANSNLYLHLIGPIKQGKMPPNLKNRIRFYGWCSPKQVRELLYQAQITVLPNSSRNLTSAFYTSPMKLLDYMATKTAIIASDLPSIRELVSENEVYFFKPDDPVSLAEAIKALSKDPGLCNKLATNAYHKVKNFTWEARAKKLYRFLKSL